MTEIRFRGIKNTHVARTWCDASRLPIRRPQARQMSESHLNAPTALRIPAQGCGRMPTTLGKPSPAQQPQRGCVAHRASALRNPFRVVRAVVQVPRAGRRRPALGWYTRRLRRGHRTSMSGMNMSILDTPQSGLSGTSGREGPTEGSMAFPSTRREAFSMMRTLWSSMTLGIR